MKTTFLKISVFILLFSFMGAGCGKDEEDLSYLDYTKALSTPPSFAVYKTKKDYFFNVSIRPYGNNFLCPELSENGSRIILYKGKYFYTERFRLIDDYIGSFEVNADSYFTSLSFDKYIREKLTPYYTQGLTPTEVVSSIIDRDPFTEFYYTSSEYSGFTIDELNQLIKEKNLEKYFKKLK